MPAVVRGFPLIANTFGCRMAGCWPEIENIFGAHPMGFGAPDDNCIGANVLVSP
jgi:hypothetical protein